MIRVNLKNILSFLMPRTEMHAFNKFTHDFTTATDGDKIDTT